VIGVADMAHGGHNNRKTRPRSATEYRAERRFWGDRPGRCFRGIIPSAAGFIGRGSLPTIARTTWHDLRPSLPRFRPDSSAAASRSVSVPASVPRRLHHDVCLTGTPIRVEDLVEVVPRRCVDRDDTAKFPGLHSTKGTPRRGPFRARDKRATWDFRTLAKAIRKDKKPPLSRGFFGGRAGRRSPDLPLFRRSLCRLSYPTESCVLYGGPDGI
jgi:hypothetical protein